TTDAFIFNRSTGTVTLVSVGSTGQAAGIQGPSVAISPDGRYVIFENNQGNVLPGVTGDQLYQRDLATGTTTLLSVGYNGSPGDHESLSPAFSADGHDVVFVSDADNLVPGMMTTGIPEANLFERDLLTGTTSLVSTYGTSIGDFYG